MLWEIVISNLITASVTGGIIACYHYYRLKKEQEYYNEIRNKIVDGATVGLQCIVSYMAAKGYSDASMVKSMLEGNPDFNHKFQPWVDPIMKHAADMSPHYNVYEPTSQFYKDFVVKPCPYIKDPGMFMKDPIIANCPKHKYNKNKDFDLDSFGCPKEKDFDLDSLDSIATGKFVKKMHNKSKKSESVADTPKDLKIEI